MDKRFKVKTQVVGSGAGEAPEGRILNRTVRCTQQGWEYEPDQRHAELIVKELWLCEANGVDTPGERLKPPDDEKIRELDRTRATEYRSMCARG